MPASYSERLLIVEDDEEMLSLYEECFGQAGYQVVACHNATQALNHIHTAGLPHLAVLDLNLPDMTGFALSERLKALGDVPIIFISADAEPDTIIQGLTRYADDYIIKPFNIREVLARVQRLLSRIPNFAYAQTPLIQIDERLAVDFANSRVILDQEAKTLTPIEANLLYILMRHAGRVVAVDTLLRRVWPNEEVYEDTVRVHMHRLRNKIEPDPHQPRYIQTERGTGYRFVPVGDEVSVRRIHAALG